MGTLAEKTPYQYRRPVGQTLFPRNWDYILWNVKQRRVLSGEKILLSHTSSDFESVRFA